MIEHVCAGLRLTSRSPICHSVPVPSSRSARSPYLGKGLIYALPPEHPIAAFVSGANLSEHTDAIPNHTRRTVLCRARSALAHVKSGVKSFPASPHTKALVAARQEVGRALRSKDVALERNARGTNERRKAGVRRARSEVVE